MDRYNIEMGADALTTRFAVGGPNGARSPIWRVWAAPGKNDLYLSGRSFAGDLKVSLHGSGVWRVGFTEAHTRRESSLVPPGRDRLIRRWKRPPEFAPGLTKAFAVAVPWLALASYPEPLKTNKEIVWIEPPAEGWEVQVFVILSRPEVPVTGWPGRRGMGTRFVGRIALPAETAWLVSHRFQVGAEDRAKLDAYRTGVRVTYTSDGTPVPNLRALLIGNDNDGCWWFRDVPLAA